MMVFNKLPWLLLSVCIVHTTNSLLSTVEAADNDWKGPRNRFWRHHVQDKTLILNGVDYFNTMMSCLMEHLTDQEWRDIDTTRAETRSVGFKLRDEYRQNKVILMILERAMAPLHVKAVQSLASCVRTIFPQFYEARSFYVELGMEEDDGKGGNNPTHLAPLVGIFLPAVFDEMQRTLQLAYEEANWSYYHRSNFTEHDFNADEILPSPDEIGFRASEHLTYKDFKEGLAPHTDGGDTFFTINFAFSGPQDYDGGFFFLKYGKGNLWGRGGDPPREQILLKPNKYDCLVFLGGPYLHGVTEMTGGNREMFSSELWNFPDAPFGSTLWMNVAARMSKYIQRCNEENYLGLSSANGACQVNMTQLQTEEEGEPEDEEEDNEEDSLPVARSWRDASSGDLMNLSSCFGNEQERFFLIPSSLTTGQTRTLYWREDGFPVDDSRAMVVGLPPQLTTSIQQYLRTSGWLDAVRNMLYPSEQEPQKLPKLYNRVIRLRDKSQWQVEPMSRRNKEPETDLVRLEMVNYTSSDSASLLNVLTEGDFGSILSSVARPLQGQKENGHQNKTNQQPIVTVGVTRLQVLALTYADDAGPNLVQEIDPDIYNEDNDDHIRLVIPVSIPPRKHPVRLGVAQRDGRRLMWGELQLRPNMGVVVSGMAVFTPGDCNLRRGKEWQVWFVVTLGRRASSSSPAQPVSSTTTRGLDGTDRSSSSSFIWPAMEPESAECPEAMHSATSSNNIVQIATESV